MWTARQNVNVRYLAMQDCNSMTKNQTNETLVHSMFAVMKVFLKTENLFQTPHILKQQCNTFFDIQLKVESHKTLD